MMWHQFLYLNSSLGPPHISGSVTARQTFRLGETIKLDCPIRGTPTPIVEWYKVNICYALHSITIIAKNNGNMSNLDAGPTSLASSSYKETSLFFLGRKKKKSHVFDLFSFPNGVCTSFFLINYSYTHFLIFFSRRRCVAPKFHFCIYFASGWWQRDGRLGTI